jgi:hypothetical protein
MRIAFANFVVVSKSI